MGKGRHQQGVRGGGRHRREHLHDAQGSPGLHRAAFLRGQGRPGHGRGGDLGVQQGAFRHPRPGGQRRPGGPRDHRGPSLLHRRRLRRQGRLHGYRPVLLAFKEERRPAGQDRHGLRRGVHRRQPAPCFHHQGQDRRQEGRCHHRPPHGLRVRHRRLLRVQAQRHPRRTAEVPGTLQHAQHLRGRAHGLHQPGAVRTHALAGRPAGILRQRKPARPAGTGVGYEPGRPAQEEPAGGRRRIARGREGRLRRLPCGLQPGPGRGQIL